MTSRRRGQILCWVAAAIPLGAAIAFTTDVALSLDPVYAMLPHPEPYFRDIVGSAVTRLRLALAIAGVVLVVLGLAAARVAMLGRVFASVWTQVVFALLIVGLPLGICELAAGTLTLGTGEQFAPDPNTGHRWRANASFPYGYVAVTTNDKGLRGPPVAYEKPPGTKRVMFVGGAMLVSRGLYLEDTFPKVAEAVLRERNPTTEVINTGITNWRVPQLVAYMRNEGHRFSPDVVVICVTIYDIVSPPPKPGGPPAPSPYTSGSSISTWRLQREKFGAYIKLRRANADEIRFTSKPAPPKAPHALRWSHPVTDPDHPVVQTAWKDSFKLLDDLIADAGKHNYQLVIVAYPFASQLLGDERARRPQAALVKFGAERNVPVLDLLPPLEAELRNTRQSPDALFVDGDHHPTRATARFIGREIARFLSL
jgi:hypothetical protein